LGDLMSFDAEDCPFWVFVQSSHAEKGRGATACTHPNDKFGKIASIKLVKKHCDHNDWIKGSTKECVFYLNFKNLKSYQATLGEFIK